MLCFGRLTALCVLLLPAMGWSQNRPAQGPRPEADTGASETASVIPVKRVVLYKNGVGYFEHLGGVRDKQDVTVSFTSGQLDDVLKIYDDQQRLRENMKARKGSAEEKLLLQRYTQQLNEQEDRLEALKKDEAQLDKQVEQAKDALARTIEDLAFDVNL